MKKILIILIAIMSFISCSDDILDIEPKDRIAETAVWSDANLIMAYHNAMYSGIEDAKGPNMMAKACGEMVMHQTNRYPGTILTATLTPDNVTDRNNFRGGGSVYSWRRDYSLIREILVFLDKMETDEVLAQDERETLVAEARVMRAFMYFRLFVRFGGVPIVTEISTQTSEFNYPRNSIDECVAYIEADIAAAMPHLTAAIHADDGEFGRLNQSAAKAILSRMYLYLASPLFSSTKDNAKWQKAADAAFDLIDDGLFSLHPDYTSLFSANSGSSNNELIWGRNYTAANSHDQPMLMLGRRWGAYGGWSATGGPTQNLVNNYDMANGEPAFIKENHVATEPNPASGYDPQNPYKDRDPRFYQSINYDGTVFRDVTLEKWVSTDGSTWGFDSYKQSGDNPRSNYTLRKFMPRLEDESVLGWDVSYTSPYHYFRLGEIYLNYAEAMFELGNEDVCREYMNMIRARPTVDMPPIPETVTGEELRTRLYTERWVELAFEEHRYFDVRRWKIAPYTEVDDLHGMDIIKDVATGEKTYTPIMLVDRAWDDKLYFVPIERDDVERSTGLTQTPGYD